MNVWKKAGTKRLVALLLTVLLAVGCLPWAGAEEAENPLMPEDLVYEDGNIVLHKQAERVGPDEWQVTVQAEVKNKPIARQNLEVVLLLDVSGSMKFCTDERAHNAGNHVHNSDKCYGYVCGIESHSHGNDCYQATCGYTAHEHSADCYGYICGEDTHTHTVSDGCYDLICTLPIHEHRRTEGVNNCYQKECTNSNSNHWSWSSRFGFYHKSGTTCVKSNNEYYQLTCTQQEHKSHNNGCYGELICTKHRHTESCVALTCVKTLHTHEDTCFELDCSKPLHTHVDSCYGLTCGFDNNTTHYKNTAKECTYVDENGVTVTYTTRLATAKQSVNALVQNLTEKFGTAGITFKYVTFSSSPQVLDENEYPNGFNDNDIVANGGTNLYHGIDKALDQFTSDDSTKKVLVIIGDGEADDDDYNDYYNDTYPRKTWKKHVDDRLEKFKNPIDKNSNNGGDNGTVFTIGFATHIASLESMAEGNGGKYIHAGNENEMNLAMGSIESSISAMLVDPMGSKVGFDIDSIVQAESSVPGSITNDGNTLYWNPVGETTIQNKTIGYSYVVKLNQDADLAVGKHSNIPLNNPTSLLYGNKSGNTITELKSAAFPIPYAEYKRASIQVNWKCGNVDVKEPTKTEGIYSDFSRTTRNGEIYTPVFKETDYTTITENIPQVGHNVYEYTGTTIEKTFDGEKTVVDVKKGEQYPEGLIDPKQAAAYVVTHHYELKEKYEIVYEYVGEVLPSNVEKASKNNRFANPGEGVEVADKPECEGYIFDGWQVSMGGALVDENGKFTMPNNDVKFVGSWSVAPAYIVEADYYLVVDDEAPIKENVDAPVRLDFVTRETSDEHTYTIQPEDRKYTVGDTEQSYTNAELKEGSVGTLNEERTAVSGITPATDTYPVVHLNFYRYETTSVPYQVIHEYYVVGPDGTVIGEKEERQELSGLSGNHGQTVAIEQNEEGTNLVVAKDLDGKSGAYTYTFEKAEPESLTLDKTSKETQTITLEYVRHLYRVTYQWEGTEQPEGVVLPEEAIYSPGVSVDVAEKPSVKGWSFDGWRIQSGLTESIDDGSFTMPNNNVVLVGSWTKIPTYSVTYEYDETAPEGAPAVPVDEEKYYAGAEAKVMPKPSMKGYTFTGWTPKTEGVTIKDNTFTMPAQNVVLVGAWAKQPSYQITVKYYTITDGVVPDTCDETFTSEVFYRKDTADVGTYTYSATAPESRIDYTDDAELSEAGSGATLNATAQQLTGIVPAEDTAQVLVKLYRKVNKAYTATVRYHDANGNSLSSDVTSAPIVFGQPYDLTDLALSVIEVETAEGKKLYRFDHDDCIYKGTPYKGIMPANSFTITRVYVEMDTAVAVVRYVDENGQPLREDLMSAPVYIGEPYNVSEAKAVDVIVQGNKEYQFKYHYQQRELVRSMGGLMAMNGDEYAGPMPVGGVIITRVYELSNETYYYQQKYVFTAYDANGDVVYSASEEWPVASTDQETVTITAPETYSHEGYGFNRKSEETQSAGLAGTTAERPHVFVVEYEMHEGDEPVPDTQLPPGLTPPQEPPKATDAPVADLPPQTGDDGVALYLVLMLCAAAGLAALIADHRKRCH